MRVYHTESPFAVIPCTGGKSVIVDLEDVPLVLEGKWFIRSRTRYVARTIWTGSTTGSPQITYLHRRITGAPKGLEVDHINRNPLDNRKSNLRVCTHAENMKNRRKINRPRMN